MYTMYGFLFHRVCRSTLPVFKKMLVEYFPHPEAWVNFYILLGSFERPSRCQLRIWEKEMFYWFFLWGKFVGDVIAYSRRTYSWGSLSHGAQIHRLRIRFNTRTWDVRTYPRGVLHKLKWNFLNGKFPNAVLQVNTFSFPRKLGLDSIQWLSLYSASGAR